jgi:hypothetical protein
MTGEHKDRTHYRVPRLLLLSFGLYLLVGRRRSFVRDSRLVLAANPHPRTIIDATHIPASGPFVLVMNHFSRPGLRPYHCAMIVTNTVAAARPGQPDIRWAFTSEYLGRRIGPVPIPLALIRWTFRRVAHVYGFVVIPRREHLVLERAASLRRFVRLLRDGSPVGLTPEGATAGAHGTLVEPPPGSGSFVGSLTSSGVPLLPVGIYEDARTLNVRFGRAESFTSPRAGRPRNEHDGEARAEMMTAIGALLPPEYRGAYVDAVARSLRHS